MFKIITLCNDIEFYSFKQLKFYNGFEQNPNQN